MNIDVRSLPERDPGRLPLPAALLSVAACIVICLVLLSRKIRAQEIVR